MAESSVSVLTHAGVSEGEPRTIDRYCETAPGRGDSAPIRAFVDVVPRRLFLPRVQFGHDAPGQDLAQFDAPLVEGIDLPDRRLGEDTVLVERDQLARVPRRQPFGKDRVRRPVAFEDAVRHQPVRRAFGLHLGGRLAERQRFALRKHIRHQHVVMLDRADSVSCRTPMKSHGISAFPDE